MEHVYTCNNRMRTFGLPNNSTTKYKYTYFKMIFKSLNGKHCSAHALQSDDGIH